MAVTVQLFNHTAKLLLNKEVTFTTLKAKLLNAGASFTASNTAINQVDGGSTATITMTIATPAVVSWTAHGLTAGTPVVFTTTGALPTGITAGTYYYVIATGLATDSFRVSATLGGSAVNTTGSQSGVHTALAAGSFEVNTNGWTPGGPTLANVAVTTVNTNDAMLDADDVSVTASGGAIGPATAATIYDDTTRKPLAYVDFGGSKTADNGTPFILAWSANGLFPLNY